MDTDFENLVESLDFRARNGKTAMKLIEAARTGFKEYESVVAETEAREEQVGSKLEEKLEASRREAAALREELKSVEAAYEGRKKPKVEVEDGEVKYTFNPPRGEWALGELEETLMYLKMMGADEETQVGIAGREISVVIDGAGFIPSTVGESVQEEPEEGKSEDFFLTGGWKWLVGSLGGGAAGLIVCAIILLLG